MGGYGDLVGLVAAVTVARGVGDVTDDVADAFFNATS